MCNLFEASVTKVCTDSKETIYTLGQTGETVVYIFPSGNALMDREAHSAKQRLQKAQVDTTRSKAEADQAWDQRLVAQGLITAAQLEVARYDQAETGISLIEALVARGWLDPNALG